MKIIHSDRLTSSITSTLDRLRIARAMQRSCFSLFLLVYKSGIHMVDSPGRKVFSALRYSEIQVTEHVRIDRFRIFFCCIFRWDQMNATNGLELTEVLVGKRVLKSSAHNLGIVVLIEHVECRTKGSTQNCWILC